MLRILAYGVALMTLITPARADVLSDCTQVKITEKTIHSCTQVIEAGQADNVSAGAKIPQ